MAHIPTHPATAERMRQLSAFDVRDLCDAAGLPFDDEGVRLLGLARVLTQREAVLAAWRLHEDVDAVFEALHRAVPKSSIRAYLGKAEAAGAIDGSWRQRRRRRVSRRLGLAHG
jgi:hypothetical protein